MKSEHASPAFSTAVAEALLADLAAEVAAPGITPDASAPGTSGIPPKCCWHHWAAWTVWACREVIRLKNHREPISGCCNACIRQTQPCSDAIRLAQVNPRESAPDHDQSTTPSESDWNRWACRELSRFTNPGDAKCGCRQP